jgi:hypothetical protein
MGAQKRVRDNRPVKVRGAITHEKQPFLKHTRHRDIVGFDSTRRRDRFTCAFEAELARIVASCLDAPGISPLTYGSQSAFMA